MPRSGIIDAGVPCIEAAETFCPLGLSVSIGLIGWGACLPAAPAPELFRLSGLDIRAEAHEAGGIARRQGDIGDASVVGMGRIDPEMRGTVDLLVGYCRPCCQGDRERAKIALLGGRRNVDWCLVERK